MLNLLRIVSSRSSSRSLRRKSLRWRPFLVVRQFHVANNWRIQDSIASIFKVFQNEDEKIPIAKFIGAVKECGLRVKDPRLKETIKNFEELLKEGEFDGHVDMATFRRCIYENTALIDKALRGDFVIPEFEKFSGHIRDIFEKCKDNTDGKVADYIPQLAKFSPDLWGVSICTVDGQRFSIGDTKEPFCLQSTAKSIGYALTLDELQSPEMVFKHVGLEPSGRSFNHLHLDNEGRPHNPMINAGALMWCSLLKPELPLSHRCDYVQEFFRRCAGGEYIGFSNATFLSERETADKNYALGYYMNSHKSFPPGTDLMETFELYFHLCSIEATCDSGSVMAATLANGGICPMTGEKVFSSVAVQSTLSLMLSCGMYDYSGEFAFHVGLPAKSGVSGAILIVVPEVCGIMVWSPPLDSTGNSVRGIQFCKELVSLYNFHHYDLVSPDVEKKLNPRRTHSDEQSEKVVSLLFAASNGDVTALRRYHLAGLDMSQKDYDGRSALHLAAAQGNLEAIKFLLQKCNVPAEPTDRWGFTPLDEAVRFGHDDCKSYLLDFMKTLDRGQ